MDFISVILTEMKLISAGSLDGAFNAHVRLKLIAGMNFILVILTEMNFIEFRLYLNTAEMKLHVNRTYFHASLKFQTGMSSFHLSCERTLTIVSQHHN